MRFGDWYREAHPGLLEAVLRAVGRDALARDALDEAFERAFTRWERVEAMRSPRGWVYRVAVNAARRQLSAEVREATAGERVTFVAAMAQPAPPPGGEAWLCVAALPVRQRTAVVLRHVAGLTEVEIAAAMGVTRSTVSSTLASAYARLAPQLAEPTIERKVVPMELQLATATSCDDAGCDVQLVATGASDRVGYSDAVRGAIKVRPGDLVAVDGDVIVWRWWHATVVRDGDTAATVVVERNVTQRAAGDPRTAEMVVEVPPELGDVQPGDVVYFGTDGERKVVVATAAPEVVLDRVAPRLPAIAAGLG